ncbi:helix-turn-helix domain-containing protein [Sphingomonas arenae]|uniref:helix-turn-helix domain-containing protein n=1 Tax=Sphingomonas arenae TaxID=2812555 RepID=UPI0019688915|nr:helix-turn-helix domain-containing protein [Sphingomonas arenae]
MPELPPWLAALPLLFAARSANDDDYHVNAALAAASAALEADVERRDSRSRISFLLAELAAQHGRRTGEKSAPIPVSLTQLARAAAINLTRVKRILGFLTLSQVVEVKPRAIRVLDWERLCKLGQYDRRWAGLAEEAEEGAEPLPAPTPLPASPITLAGEPASFV